MSKPPLPRAIWVLGFVSLFMDISSEMVHSLLPLLMVGPMGASAFAVGLVEGVAEATALLVKGFSGVWSDRLGQRKRLALIGYGLGAASKPLFALATGVGLVLFARFSDRVGKGIRGAPRDALIADLTPPAQRGAAFGLRQSLDTVGALLGPLIASGLLLLWANDLRAVMAVAVLPALVSVALLAVGVREPALKPQPRQAGEPGLLRQLPAAVWVVTAVGALFMLARFSEAFLVLRAADAGVPLAAVPLAMVAMNLVYAGAAYPLGQLADRVPAKPLLAAGLLVLVAADLLLARATSWPWLAAGLLLWGLHMALTQGLLAAMVAHAAPPHLRGTAFGAFNAVSGVALLLASLIAGWMWDRFGAAATFQAGAALALLALVAVWGALPSARR